MGTVYKQKDRVSYNIQYKDPSTGRLVTKKAYRDYAASVAMLRDEETKAARRAAGLLPPEEPKVLPPQALDALIPVFIGLGSRGTVWRSTCRQRLVKVLSTCRFSLPSHLDLDAVLAFLAPMKSKTRNQYLHLLTAFGEFLVDRGHLTKNPFTKAPRYRETDTQVRAALTRDQVEGLLAKSKYRAFYAVAVYTGLRKSEIRRLRWYDVKSDRISLPGSDTKNGQTANLPLHPTLKSILEPMRRRDEDPVFPTLPGHDTLPKDFAKCGLPAYDARGFKISLHSLRKTFGTWLAVAGAPESYTQQLMRHADSRLTSKLYRDAGQLETRKYLDLLPALSA
jgi:integrase